MKTCGKCGAEYNDDEMFCSKCGAALIGDGATAYCKYCGCSLVNDYEREQGCCVNCEDVRAHKYSAASSPKKQRSSKYKKVLKVAEILNYIGGVIGMFAVIGRTESFIIGGLVLTVCICNGSLYGAVRELLDR